MSGGAKWASTEKQRRLVLMTHLSHATRWRRARACTPAALTMIPLPRSLTPSPSSGSHQDSDDLMMRETTLIIHTRQTSPLAVPSSRTDTRAFKHTQTRTDNDRGPHAVAHAQKYTKTNTGMLASRASTVRECRRADEIKKNHGDAHAHTDANQNSSTDTHTQMFFGNTHTPPHTHSTPLGQTVFTDNFVIICFGFTQAPVWCSFTRAKECQQG